MLKERVESQGWLLADGAMGTMLIERGLAHGDPPEMWNLERPDEIAEVHRTYIEAGAQIILTNSFGGNRLRLQLHSQQDQSETLNRSAAMIARSQADAAQDDVLVGGSMGPTGKLLQPLGELTFEEAAASFAEQATALLEGGVDMLWIETMSAVEELHAAMEGSRRVDPDIPIVATMTFDTHGHTAMGVSPEAAMGALLELNLEALGANCGNGPQEIETVIAKMHDFDPRVVLVAKSNAGIPRVEGDRTVYDATPQVMAEHARKVFDLGARIIGACCGSTPEHLRAMRRALEERG
jgi:5-methyltetrahydrofolate--homocysteine methyltransferase